MADGVRLPGSASEVTQKRRADDGARRDYDDVRQQKTPLTFLPGPSVGCETADGTGSGASTATILHHCCAERQPLRPSQTAMA